MGRSTRSGLRMRLLLLVAFAVIPALLIKLYTGLQFRNIMATRSREGLLRLAKIASTQESQLIEGTRQVLIALAQVPELKARNTDPAACAVLLGGLLKQYPTYMNIGLIDLNGDVVASAEPLSRPVNVADRGYFQRAVGERNFALGEYQTSRITGRPNINCAYPVLNDLGKLQGVLFISIELSWLAHLAQEANLPEGAVLTVMDREGTILLRYPGGAEWLGKSALEEPALRRLAGGVPDGTEEAPGTDGSPWIYGFTSLADSARGVTVIVGRPLHLAFADVNQVLSRTFLALGLIALLALAAALIGAQAFILRPVNRLVNASRRLGSGDLTARGGLAGEQGELGELARAFDEMAESLQQREADREAAQTALRREYEFTDTIMSTADALIIAMDREGRVVRFNSACERVSGFSFDEVRGKPFWEVVLPADEVDRVLARFRQLQAGHFPNKGENDWISKSGQRRLISWSNTAITDDQGEVEFIIATGIDITDLRKVEDELRLDERRMQALLALGEMGEASLQEITDFAMEEGVKLTNSTIGYVAFTNEDETVLTMNSWSKTAMTQCTIVDKPIVYPVATCGVWAEPLRQRRPVITNDYQAPDPLKRGYPAGHVEVKRHLGVPVFEGDRIVAVVGVGNKAEPYGEADVLQLRLLTDAMWRLLHRRQAAEDLRRAHDELELRVEERTEQLARSNAELERFAYVASHDLQEPLRKIVAFGDRLAAKAGDALGPDPRDYLERMQSAARRMQTLINDLLTYARVTTRGQPFEPVDLGVAAAEVLSDLEVLVEQAGAEVQVGELPTLDADPMQMRQLLQNLIGNAIKFRRDGVTPKVKVWAEVGQGDGDPDSQPICRLYVQDNGIGFDEKHAERIFAVFQRLHSREEYEGTGIGLAVCRRIAERHGGTVTATGTPGEGATFVVALPLKQDEGGTDEWSSQLDPS